jgi:hypothetical protein
MKYNRMTELPPKPQTEQQSPSRPGAKGPLLSNSASLTSAILTANLKEIVPKLALD